MAWLDRFPAVAEPEEEPLEIALEWNSDRLIASTTNPGAGGLGLRTRAYEPEGGRAGVRADHVTGLS